MPLVQKQHARREIAVEVACIRCKLLLLAGAKLNRSPRLGIGGGGGANRKRGPAQPLRDKLNLVSLNTTVSKRTT
jgi:hypothetical protein